MTNGTDLSRAAPVLDTTSMDAESMIEDLIQYARLNYPEVLTDFNYGQLARLLIDIVGYQFDLTTFYLNALLNETFVQTALRRNNLLRKGRDYGYVAPSARAATTQLLLTLDPLATYPRTLRKNDNIFTTSGSPVVEFSLVSDVLVPDASPVTVDAHEGTLVLGEIVGYSDGTDLQQFTLTHKNLIDDSLEVYVNGALWEAAITVVSLQSTDKKFTVFTDDQNVTFITFGDGTFGEVPLLNHAITVNYRYGGGHRGTLGSGAIRVVRSVDPAVLAVTNPEATVPGAPRPSMRQIKAEIPAQLDSINGAINATNLANAAVAVAGVSKASAKETDPLAREISLYIAPSGGGAPSDALKSLVQRSLRGSIGLGLRYTLQDPTYKGVSLSLLVHALPGFKKASVAAALTQVLSNPELTGVYDFDAVSFRGIDSNGNLEFSSDRLHDLADELSSVGLRRLEVLGLTALPQARRLRNNTGNGSVINETLLTNDHTRREWLIRFMDNTTFEVYERIIGTVTGIQHNGIEDDSQDFPNLVTQGFGVIRPNRDAPSISEPPIASNTSTTVLATMGGRSMFTLTEIGSSYYVERLLPLTGTVSVPYTAIDGAGNAVLSFTMDPGTSPWANSDELIIDVFPPRGDLSFRADEIPILSLLSIRVAGGVS